MFLVPMASSAIDEYVLLQDLADVINETKLQLYHTRSTNRFNQNAFFTLAMSLIIFCTLFLVANFCPFGSLLTPAYMF